MSYQVPPPGPEVIDMSGDQTEAEAFELQRIRAGRVWVRLHLTCSGAGCDCAEAWLERGGEA